MSLISQFIISSLLFFAAASLFSVAIADTESSALVLTSPSFEKRVAPKYPRSRQRKGLAGAVELSLMVDEHGKPFEIVVLRSSHVDFEQSAITAVGKYLYTPAAQNGLPVAARDRLVVYYEIEGQFNTMSKDFHRWIGKDGGLFTGGDAEEAAASKSLKKGLRRTKSRCDCAWLSVFQNQFALKFKSLEAQIETAYNVLMFDYDLEQDRRCFTDEHQQEFYRSLLRLLIEAEKLGEVVQVVKRLGGLGLDNLLDEFSPAIKKLSESAQKIQLISSEELNLNANQALIELAAPRFQVDINPEELDRLTLRCANGFQVLEKLDGLSFELNPELKDCQLRIELNSEDKA